MFGLKKPNVVVCFLNDLMNAENNKKRMDGEA